MLRALITVVATVFAVLAMRGLAVADQFILTPSVDGYINRFGGAPCGTSPHEAESLLIVKTWENENRSSRAVIRFDLSGIPPGSQVGSAKIYLYALREINYFTNDFHVSRLTESWSASQANWCNRNVGNPWCTQGGCFTSAGQVTRSVPSKFGGGQGNYDEWIEWDVTPIVNSWVRDGQPNFGFIVWQTPFVHPHDREFQFASAQYPNAGLRPYLDVRTCQISDPMPLVEDTTINRDGAGSCGTEVDEALFPYMSVSSLSTYPRESRSLVRFLLPSINPSVLILSATLRLYATFESEYATNGFHVSRVVEPWTAAEADWCEGESGMPWCAVGSCKTDSGETVTTVQSQFEGGNGAYNAWIEFPVGAIVKAWVEAGAPNYGFVIWQTPFEGGNQEIQFATKEHANPDLRPQLFLCTEFGRVGVTPAVPSASTSLHLRITPNPDRGGARVEVDLPAAARGSIDIYDIAGRLVRRLLPSQEFSAGRSEASWDGRADGGVRVAVGVYVA